MDLFEGPSTDPSIVDDIRSSAASYDSVLLSLDSNHTHDHVLAELNAYGDLVTLGSYCIVFDTVIERLPSGLYTDRPWDVGDNPMTACRQWLKTHPEFSIDQSINNRLQISVAPDGYLKRIS